MHVELTTGKDSFKARTNNARRNVSVQTWTRVDDDGQGRQIVPLFVAYQTKLRGFRNTKLVNTIPATSNFSAGLAGEWYVNRHEVLPGTEIMLEYRHREAVGFGDQTEYMLLIAEDAAPLVQLRLDLPPHDMSAVPHIFFEGRFIVVREDSELSGPARLAWKDWIGIGDDYDLADMLDANMGDEAFFSTIELEAALKKTTRTEVKSEGGKRRIKIKRTRQIKTR